VPFPVVTVGNTTWEVVVMSSEITSL
jgi:hypothetical protein